METIACACAQADATRTDGGAGMGLGDQRARSVVERGRESHARGLPEVLVRPSGVGVAARYRAAPPAHFMNRRMRNRMYGGVGGRRGCPGPLPDRPSQASWDRAQRRRAWVAASPLL